MIKYLFILFAGCVVLSVSSCTDKGALVNVSPGDSLSFTGTWVTAPIFQGSGRGFAVSFTIGDSTAFVGTG